MNEMKITGATYIWDNNKAPGVELELNFATPDGIQQARAIIAEVGPSLFDDGLVYLHGKTIHDMKVLSKCLPPKEIPGWPGEMAESVTDDPRIIKIVNHLYDAANYRKGLRFEEGKSLPHDLLQ